ncbi:MAG TPA: hypothetical protein VLD37_07495 [Candidatus Bilamarchaeum sp.]|nr:hypothetical protein [Candidatus Bilamarchaeum sp.]
MRLRSIIVGLVVVLLLILAGIVVVLLFGEEEGMAKDHAPSTFSVLESGAAGEYAYSVYNYRGTGNLTILGYEKPPKRKVTIINDSQAIEATKLQDLIEQMRVLEKYGFTVTISDEPKINDGINIVPTGAIPSYALFNLQQNSSDSAIVYFGAKDLLISNGIKQLNWYSSLTPAQRSRVVLINTSLDDFIDSGNKSLARDILLNSWAAGERSQIFVSGAGIGTAAARINRTGYVRLVYEFDDTAGIFDSPRLEQTNQTLATSPQTILPNERSSLQFLLNKTNGTAFLSVKKDGKTIEHEQLRRVTDENVFLKKFEYPDPGWYVITVDDNSGPIASGMLHIRDIEITLLQKRGVTYTFSALADGAPMGNTEALVSLGDSETKRKYFISDGTVTVNAKLDKGENIFNFELAGTKIPVTVVNQEDPFLDFYIKYGVPGLIIVAAVYFGARASRRPTYRIRFGDSADSVRQEITLPLARALESFSMIRKEMNLGSNPITAQEFAVSLKRYLTNGADVTEGNVEEILKKLVKSGHLESHRDYYQLKGEGDIKRNTLRRMIKEKLIESGTMFSESGSKFVSKDFEVGFFGDKFTRKAIIVVDDKSELNHIFDNLGQADSARLKLMQANDTVQFVTIDRLGDML